MSDAAAATTVTTRKGRLLVPSVYTAGNGDMHVQLHYDARTLLGEQRLRISRRSTDSAAADGDRRTVAALIDVYPDPRANITQITVPCQQLLLGGLYDFELIGGADADADAEAATTSPENNDPPAAAAAAVDDERLRRQLDIRWPVPKLSVTPESIGTYPEGPVQVVLEFPGVECALRGTGDTGAAVPEFWLELFYCGVHEVYCDSANVSAAQVLYREQVRGYPRVARVVKLRCELFGLAGHYVVKLRPLGAVLASVSATAFVKVSSVSGVRIFDLFYCH